MLADVNCIWTDLKVENRHDVLKSTHQFFIIEFVHQLQVAFQHHIKAWADELHGLIVPEYRLKRACGLESNWKRLLLLHASEDAFDNLLDVALMLKLQLAINTISPASSQPHERLL